MAGARPVAFGQPLFFEIRARVVSLSSKPLPHLTPPCCALSSSSRITMVQTTGLLTLAHEQSVHTRHSQTIPVNDSTTPSTNFSDASRIYFMPVAIAYALHSSFTHDLQNTFMSLP